MDAHPERIGRYEIIRELGRGTMGVVYEARDSVLDRTVALKSIQLAFGASEAERQNFEERFFTEARSAARLSHPGIVVVHDVGRDPDSALLFMALEHLNGRPLSTFYDVGKPMPWRQALSIVRRVAEALGHAHNAGVVHRDIKPANIMVLDSGEPKLMDFGIAKLQTDQAQLTSTGQFFGTPLYMSPEQALGEPVDGRSDLFSLGALAYALVTGQAPFSGENVPQILLKVAHDDPDPPSRLNPELPAGVDELLLRSVAKAPADRYQDGGAMAQAIQAVLASIPGTALGTGRLTSGGPFAQPPIVPPLTPPPVLPEPSEQGPDVVPATKPSGSQVRKVRPPRPAVRVESPGRTRPYRTWAIGLGLLVAVLAVAGVVQTRRSTQTADTRSGRLEATPFGAETSPPEPSTQLPVPTTLLAEDAESLSRAIAARLSGDLEQSRDILLEVLRERPDLSRAEEMLDGVEAELWAQEALPIQYGAEHNHRIGSCRGQLTLGVTEISFRSQDHGWNWSYDAIQAVQRKSRWSLELVTSESETLRLGGDKRYRFKLTREGLPREDWARFVRLTQTD